MLSENTHAQCMPRNINKGRLIISKLSTQHSPLGVKIENFGCWNWLGV